MRTVVARPEVLFLRKNLIGETGRSQGHVQKGLQNVCTSTIEVSPDSLSPAPSTSSALKMPENKKEEADDPESACEWDIQVEDCSD